MRFLCLHGRGSCAKIFEMQTARIREELEDHEFVFVDGMIPTEPSDDAAAAITDQAYGYIPACTDEPANYRAVLSSLVEYVQGAGPFDGVMGFSEGAIVASALLLEDARRPFVGFKCGILFSAAAPWDPDGDGDGDLATLRCVDPAVDGVLLRIPVAIVVEEGLERLRDRSPLAGLWTRAGVVDAQRALVQICDESVREVVHSRLGHRVPGSNGSSEGLGPCLLAIERTIARVAD